MPNVYLIQQPREKIRNIPIDLEPARKYGRLISILHEDVNASVNTSLVFAEIEKGLRQFNCHCDYIVWAIGDPLALFMAGAALARRGVPYFNWLKYSKRMVNGSLVDVTYNPVKVSLALPPPAPLDLAKIQT